MERRHISVSEICNSINMKYRILGLSDRYVSMPSPITEANEKSISFCTKEGEDALKIISETKAKVIFCSNELLLAAEDIQNKTLILVSNPRLAFIRVMQRYFEEKIKFGIHPSTVIDEKAKISSNVYIGPNSYIGACEIEENTAIHGNVFVYPNVKIGRNVIIQAGTVIGTSGFSYEKNEQGEFERFPHIGGVIIEDDVEIGSNVSIDRGTIGNTIIGRGTKIDNLCHIAHNVVIGKHCTIIAQSMIGGSTRIGDYSWVSPQACLRDGIKIGKNVVIGMGSIVTKDVEDGWIVFGVPAKKVRKAERQKVKFRI